MDYTQILSTNQIATDIESFINNGELDQEAFRTSALAKLSRLHLSLDTLLTVRQHRQRIRTLHDSAAIQKDTATLQVIAHILSVSEQCRGWITQTVETPERFSFFILSKAQEITVDREQSMRHAQLIRHDQLAAVGAVFAYAERVLRLWFGKKDEHHAIPNSVRNFFEPEIEHHIYELATRYYQVRKQKGQL